jgi:hypothetical protein
VVGGGEVAGDEVAGGKVAAGANVGDGEAAQPKQPTIKISTSKPSQIFCMLHLSLDAGQSDATRKVALQEHKNNQGRQHAKYGACHLKPES